MNLYFGATEITGLYFGDTEITGLYFGDTEIWAAWAEYDGTLPAQYNANGSTLADYRIYGNAGGVGDDSGTAYGYEVGMSLQSANLFDKSKCDPRTNVYLDSDGVINTMAPGVNQWTVSDYIPITPNVSIYTASGLSVGGKSTYCCVYDSNKIFRRSYLITANQNVSITTQSGDAYVRLSVRLINHEIDTAMFYADTTATIYIGDTPLGENEYADYGEQKVYRMVNGVLTPTDPPVPLPALPTVDGANIVDYTGQSTAVPERFYARYRRG